MSKKVKCIECENLMFFAIPHQVSEVNYEYAKHCLEVIKRSFVCGETNKTKRLDNEQYCKHFRKADCIRSNAGNVKWLEEVIVEYEKTMGVV